METCNLCGDKKLNCLFETTDSVSGRKFKILECQDCSLAFSSPQPSLQELKGFYPQEYYSDNDTVRFGLLMERVIKLHRWLRLRKIKPYLPERPGRMLDIGCGCGWQLKYFQERGWEVCGTELSESSSCIAREKLGLNIIIGDINDCEFPSEWFDVVVLWHTLEHLVDPKGTLIEVSRVIKKGGLVFVSVPNFYSWRARLFKKFWYFLDAPRHLYHFSLGSLKKLLEMNDFAVVSCSLCSPDYGLMEFPQSLMDLLGGERNFLWDFTTQKTGQVKRLSKIKLGINLFLLAILFPFAVIFWVLAEILSILTFTGPVLTVVAKKS
jgi:SAM-dependent methyltransferase